MKRPHTACPALAVLFAVAIILCMPAACQEVAPTPTMDATFPGLDPADENLPGAPRHDASEDEGEPAADPFAVLYKITPLPYQPSTFLGTGVLAVPETIPELPARSEKTRFKFGSLFEHDTDVSFHPDGCGVRWSGYERLRLRGNIGIGRSANVFLEWKGDNLRGLREIPIFEPIFEPPNGGPEYYWWPPEIISYKEQAQDIERLQIDLNFPGLHVRTGRQAIDWGQGFLFTPTNPYQSKNLYDADREVEGTDALRSNFFIGDTLEVDLVVATTSRAGAVGAPSTLNASRVGGYCRYGQAGGAFSGGFTGAYDADSEVTSYGGNMAAKSRQGSRLFFEAAGFRDALNMLDYGRLVGGGELALPAGWRLGFEYYHDGAGVEPAYYTDVLYFEVLTGQRQTIGRDYAVTVIERRTATTFFRCYSLTNLADAGSLIVPEFTWRLLAGIRLQLGGTLVAGPPGSEFRPQGHMNLYDYFDRSSVYLRFRADF